MVVVTGKGGVGRSSAAAALAVAAARTGRTACVVELSGMASVPPMFGLRGRSFEFREATDGVWVWSLTVPECLDDFGRRKLKLPGLVRRLFQTRATRTFVDAIPGLHDLLQLGKIENLINEPLPSDPHFDLFVVDAPATGHGLTLLSAARSMTEVAKAGPFHDLAENIGSFLEDPDATGVALVTLPEELPVSESLELVDQLREIDQQADAVLVNRCMEQPLPSPPPRSVVLELLDGVQGGDGMAQLVRQAGDQYDAQVSSLQALGEQLPHTPRAALPVVDEPARIPHVLGETLAEVL